MRNGKKIGLGVLLLLLSILAIQGFFSPALANEIWVDPAVSPADLAKGKWAAAQGTETIFSL